MPPCPGLSVCLFSTTRGAGQGNSGCARGGYVVTGKRQRRAL